jgi:signal transduction histidine kinase
VEVPPAHVARARTACARALAEQGFDATCVWVLDGPEPGVIVEWPSAAERLYGMRAALALGRPRHGPAGSAPVRGGWGEVLRALRRSGWWEGEVAHEADGGRLFTDTRLLLVPAADDAAAGETAAEGGPPLVVEIARDVTARRVAEEALEASENRLAAVIGSALDAIVTVDEGQRVVLFNAAAERLFGVPAAAALGELLDRFIPARFRAAHRRHVADFGAAGVSGRKMSPARGVPLAPAAGLAERAARPGTVLALRADGTEFPIEAAISQVDAPGGRLYTVIVRDVSERVRAEAERDALVGALEGEQARLAESARHAEAARAEADAARFEAEAASHAKSAFLATMSHELRTPLNAVLGYSELIELGIAGPVTASQARYVERIAGSARQLLALMDDVLDLSKIEAGRMTVARRRCGVRGVVREALALVRPQAAARDIDLGDDGCGRPAPPRPDGADDGPAYLGDEHRVRQVLVNLLSNAVKYTDRGGRVRVSCAAAPARGDDLAGPWVAIRVSDTGVGIPREHHELVFARFQQVDPGAAAGPYRRTQGGTGLGLAIGRELARLMGGDLTVESEPGRGSTFTLWLPAAGAPEAAPPPPAAARAAVGPLLADASRRVVAAWADRLRADPMVPGAAAASPTELEDHMASFVADLAQQFAILDDAAAPGAERLARVRDGAEVRQLLNRRHGAQRARLGWDEAALAREFTLLGEEVERVLVARLGGVPADAVDDARGLVRAWLADAARESAAALRAARGGAGA